LLTIDRAAVADEAATRIVAAVISIQHRDSINLRHQCIKTVSRLGQVIKFLCVCFF
jgi:hypothetical protein